MRNLDWPLMENNITRTDLDRVIEYLSQDEPRLTHGPMVARFEREWSDWLGVEYSVYVNSGASANLLTISALREDHQDGEIIVPPLTWVSDIAAVLQCGFAPVFVDIDRRTLGMDTGQVLDRVSDRTRAVFLTHVLGYNALDETLLRELEARNILLIEDACESHGATFQGRKLGSFGAVSNFSFYYAHHLSTVEGGMICTNSADWYERARMLRSHGMVRESSSPSLRQAYQQQHADLSPDFIFAFAGYNMRPTEIGAVIGLSQLGRLDESNLARVRNLELFLTSLDPERYQTDFMTLGSCNYALTLVLKMPDVELCEKVMSTMRELGVEFRRGLSGGGNQLRQPYLQRRLGAIDLSRFPNVEHVHRFGFYLGNYPTLEHEKIADLCATLNSL